MRDKWETGRDGTGRGDAHEEVFATLYTGHTVPLPHSANQSEPRDCPEAQETVGGLTELS